VYKEDKQFFDKEVKMTCEMCGTEMKPLFNGDYPTIWKCPNCGHLQVEEDE